MSSSSINKERTTNTSGHSSVLKRAYSNTKIMITNLIATNEKYIEIGNYKYCEDDLIGKGYSSKVYKGSDLKGDSKKYAIKVMDLKKIKGFLMELLKKQIQIHRNLEHENIVKCYDAIETPEKIYLVLEYCTGGDLSTFLAQRKKITEVDSLKIMNQVVEGYKYLMSQNVLHRDLKPCNVLKAGKYWKIADFGFATKKDQLDDINVGTPVYMPPQALERSEYSHQSDFFSLGVLMHEIIYGKVPWYSKSETLLQKKMSLEKIDLSKEKFVASPQIKRFILKCCEVDISKRTTEQEFLSFQLYPEKKKFDLDIKLKLKVSKSKSKEKSKKTSPAQKLTGVKKVKDRIMNPNKKTNQKVAATQSEVNPNISKSDDRSKSTQIEATVDCEESYRENSELLYRQVQFCKHLYFMIKNLEFFHLSEMSKEILSVIVYKHIIYLLKKMKNNNFNYFELKKWAQYKKSLQYGQIQKQVSLNLQLTEKQYLRHLKHKDIKVLRIVNTRFPELSHDAEFTKKFHIEISEYLRALIVEFNEISEEILNTGTTTRMNTIAYRKPSQNKKDRKGHQPPQTPQLNQKKSGKSILIKTSVEKNQLSSLEKNRKNKQLCLGSSSQDKKLERAKTARPILQKHQIRRNVQKQSKPQKDEKIISRTKLNQLKKTSSKQDSPKNDLIETDSNQKQAQFPPQINLLNSSQSDQKEALNPQLVSKQQQRGHSEKLMTPTQEGTTCDNIQQKGPICFNPILVQNKQCEEPFTEKFTKLYPPVLQALQGLYQYFCIMDSKISADLNSSFSIIDLGIHQLIGKSQLPLCLLRDYKETKIGPEQAIKIRTATKFI